MFVSTCAKCGEQVESRKQSFPLFKLTINRPLTNKYTSVVLCEECQDSLWRWIFVDDKEKEDQVNAESEGNGTMHDLVEERCSGQK